ncbi:unnamed protein product [Diamesa tonsa]
MKYNFDIHESLRRVRKLSYRKLLILLICFSLLVIYSLRLFLFPEKGLRVKDPLNSCIDDSLTRFYSAIEQNDVNIRGGLPTIDEEEQTNKLDAIPYIGNGIFGLEISQDAHFNIKEGRALLLEVPFAPIVSLSTTNGEFQESFVVEYINGLTYRFQCFNEYSAKYQYYAHRNHPGVFVQEIQIQNYKNQLMDVALTLPRIIDWTAASSQTIKIQQGSKMVDYQVLTGYISSTIALQKVRAVSICYRLIPRMLTLKKRGITNLNLLTTINYSAPITREQYSEFKERVENSAISSMKKIVEELHSEEDTGNTGDILFEFRKQHVKVWNSLWQTGFYISKSKAENALNGDKINATIYAVLSHSRAFEYEESITPQRKNQIAHDLTYAEGCFDSYHTLQAENLWKDMKTLDEANQLVASWMLTLEKQGCHNLIRAGASGIIQSMVLSFGGFRFSNQHLEFNIHPKYLHRDFTFRRLNYGNMTHVNVTVRVREDNKAEMEVVLDRSDRNYYACDGGCLDIPVELGPMKKVFPVKLTEPLTAILYITSDKQHMEELRQAIHVSEILEAPAHETHLILLHKHGSNLAGLPTLFWISIVAIIIVFHVFLCKLIVKEYCEPPSKVHYRYSKP